MNSNSKKGFSLIEVMVATTILMIIVIMVGNIFRHATSAWNTGYSTAEGVSGVRSVLGIFQRELAEAIDGREFEDWETPILVDGNSVKFYRYTDPMQRKMGYPELQLVEYQFSRNEVKRRAKTIGGNGNSSVKDEVLVSLYSKAVSVGSNLNVDIDFEVGSTTIDPKDLYVNDDVVDDFWNVPFVWVKAKIIKNVSFSGIEARSYGPDGDRGTKDDIIAR